MRIVPGASASPARLDYDKLLYRTAECELNTTPLKMIFKPIHADLNIKLATFNEHTN